MNMATSVPEQIRFEKGPPHRFEAWLGLIGSGSSHVGRRAILVAVIGWLPLALLTLAHGDFWRPDRANAFALDFGAYARLLIASPLLVLAEPLCAKLTNVARQFLAGGLLAHADRDAYQSAVQSTRRLLESRAAELGVFVLAYLLVMAIYAGTPHDAYPAWHGAQRGGTYQYTPAGWWALLVSLPLLQVLLLGWLWRIAMWTRFLWRMSRLELRLIPSHPDHAGGLKFLDSSLQALAPLGFTFGVIAAGAVMNQVVHRGAPPLQFRYLAAGVAVFAVVLCTAPLLVFWRRLAPEHHRGVFEYGALANRVGEQLEAKWLSKDPIDAHALEVSDFSATIDLYSIAGNAYAMRKIPVEPRSIAIVALATLLPFVPVLLMAIPLDVALKKVAGLFL